MARKQRRCSTDVDIPYRDVHRYVSFIPGRTTIWTIDWPIAPTMLAVRVSLPGGVFSHRRSDLTTCSSPHSDTTPASAYIHGSARSVAGRLMQLSHRVARRVRFLVACHSSILLVGEGKCGSARCSRARCPNHRLVMVSRLLVRAMVLDRSCQADGLVANARQPSSASPKSPEDECRSKRCS